ncbi:hypothetical protein TGVAND_249490 [Toxoplasma gondii VAND]|uniref:Uncharacterized protein n=1 Tax=Toxoplasma gondii VAND TaxID=933077 RepID=A0A086QH97_TOXGO|nr:hypothetical protein TGVAND_249490 [Toxoplasma gondii VAND]
MSENELLRLLKSLSVSPSYRSHGRGGPKRFFAAASSLPPGDWLLRLPTILAKDPRRIHSLPAKELALSLHAISRLWLSAGWRPDHGGGGLDSSAEKRATAKTCRSRHPHRPRENGGEKFGGTQRLPARQDSNPMRGEGKTDCSDNIQGIHSESSSRDASCLSDVWESDATDPHELSLKPGSPWLWIFRAFEEACTSCLLRQLAHSRNHIVGWTARQSYAKNQDGNGPTMCSGFASLRPSGSSGTAVPSEVETESESCHLSRKACASSSFVPPSLSPNLSRLKASESFFAARRLPSPVDWTDDFQAAARGRREETPNLGSFPPARKAGFETVCDPYTRSMVTAPPHLLLPQDLSMFLSSLLSLGVRPSAPFLAAACCYVFVYAPHFPPQALVLAAYNICRTVSLSPSGRAFVSLEHEGFASSLDHASSHQTNLIRLLLTQSIAVSPRFPEVAGGCVSASSPSVFPPSLPSSGVCSSVSGFSDVSLSPQFPSSPAAKGVPPSVPPGSHGHSGRMSPHASAQGSPPRFASPLQLLAAALLGEMAAKSSTLKAVDWCCGLQALHLLSSLISPLSAIRGISLSPVKDSSRYPLNLSCSSLSDASAHHTQSPSSFGSFLTGEPGFPSFSPFGLTRASLSSESVSPLAEAPLFRDSKFSSLQHETLRAALDLAAHVAQTPGGQQSLFGLANRGSTSAPPEALQALLRLLPPQIQDFPATSLSNTALAVSRLHKILNLLSPQSSTDAAFPGAFEPALSLRPGSRKSPANRIEEGRSSLDSQPRMHDGESPPSVAALFAPVYIQLCRRSRQLSRERPGLPLVSCVILLSSLVDGLRALKTGPSPPSVFPDTFGLSSISVDSSPDAVPQLSFRTTPRVSALESHLEAEILSVFSATVPLLLSPAAVLSRSSRATSSPDHTATGSVSAVAELYPKCQHGAATHSFSARHEPLRLAWDPVPRDLVDLVGSLSFMIARVRESSRKSTPEHCRNDAVAPSPSPSQTAFIEDLQLLLMACSTHVVEALSGVASACRSSASLSFADPDSSEQQSFSFSQVANSRSLPGSSRRPAAVLTPRDVSTIALHLRRCDGLTPALFRAFSNFLADRKGHSLFTGTDFCCFLEALVRLDLPGASALEENLKRRYETRADSGEAPLFPKTKVFAAACGERQETSIGGTLASSGKHRAVDAPLEREAARLSVHLLDGVLPTTISRFDARALSSFALWLGHHFQSLQIFDQSGVPGAVSRELSTEARNSSAVAASFPLSTALGSSWSSLEASNCSTHFHELNPLPALSLVATRGQLERAANVLLKEVARRCMTSVSTPDFSHSSSSSSLFSEGRSYTALLCGLCKLPRAIVVSSLSVSPGKPRLREASDSRGDTQAVGEQSARSSFTSESPCSAMCGVSPLSPSRPGRTAEASAGFSRDQSPGRGTLSCGSALPPSAGGTWSAILRVLLDPARVKAFLSSPRTTDGEFADFLWAVRHLPLLPASARVPSSSFPSLPSSCVYHTPSSSPPWFSSSSSEASPADDDEALRGLSDLREDLLKLALGSLGASGAEQGSSSVSAASDASLQAPAALSLRVCQLPAPLAASTRMQRLRRDPEALSRVFFYTVLLGATSEEVLSLFYPALLSCLASTSHRHASLDFAVPVEVTKTPFLQQRVLKPAAFVLSALRTFPNTSRRLREQKLAVCAAALSFLSSSCSSSSSDWASSSMSCASFPSPLSPLPNPAACVHGTPGPLTGVPVALDYGRMIEAALAAAAEQRVNEPAEALAALSRSFLRWALNQAALTPGASGKHVPQETPALTSGWRSLVVRVAVALRSLDFSCALFLLPLLSPISHSLSAVSCSSFQPRKHAENATSWTRTCAHGVFTPRLKATPQAPVPGSILSSSALPPAVFPQLSELLLCIVCAAGPHVRRELQKVERRGKGDARKERNEEGESVKIQKHSSNPSSVSPRPPVVVPEFEEGSDDRSDICLIHKLYFGEATVGLLQTLLELHASSLGSQTNDVQRRLVFLSLFLILQDAVSLGLALPLDYVRLLHALSMSVALDGRKGATGHETFSPSAAQAAALSKEATLSSQTGNLQSEERPDETWNLNFPGAGSAEKPESSALHKEVLTVTQRLVQHGRWPEESEDRREKASVLNEVEWSLDDEVRDQEERTVVAEARLGRLYYIDILVTENRGREAKSPGIAQA